MESLSIFLANDHSLFADGLSRILMEKPGVTVDKIVHDSRELTEALHFTQPDILIFDMELPGLSEIDQARQILDEYQNMKLMIMSMHEEINKIKEAIDIGIHGFITWDSSKEELYSAIDSVMLGEHYYSHILQKSIFSKDKHKPHKFAFNTPFSKKEREVLKLMAAGLSTKCIADKMHLSPYTIETHRKHMLLKVNCKNSLELIGIVKENRWI
jgi:DNA-binding NarL/FixJ family response regulator